MRHLILLLPFALLIGCATLDPNLKALTDSDKEQQTAALQASALAASERSRSVMACANSEKAEACMLGLVATELAANAGGAGKPTVVKREYQRPPTWLEQLGGFAERMSPLANAFVTLDAGRQNARTQRALAQINADREVAVTQAWSSTTTGVAHEFASQPPSYNAGGNIVMGDNTTAGGDQVGGDEYRGPYAGRDQAIGNDNRQGGSSGPIDSHEGDCRDTANCPPADTGGGGG